MSMTIRKATSNDVDNFQPAHDDILEAAAAGLNWHDTLMMSLCDTTVVLLKDNQVVALGGNNGDMCWFVTDKIVDTLTPSERIEFRKAIMGHRDFLLEFYDTLWNYVWAGNKSHIRFMKSIGAKFHQDFVVMDKTGEKFQLFTLTK